jgi:hypothetical protein
VTRKNTLNNAVDLLEEEIRKYVHGDRSQRELPLEKPGGEEDPDLFSEE